MEVSTPTIICRSCRSALQREGCLRRVQGLPLALQQRWIATKHGVLASQRRRPAGRLGACQSRPAGRLGACQSRPLASATSTAGRTPTALPYDEISGQHQRVQELGNSLLRTETGKLPEEQRVLYVLEQYEAMARLLQDPKRVTSSHAARIDTSATSALLGSVNARQSPHLITRTLVLSAIADAAYAIAKHPRVFITPAVLAAYVQLQSLLEQPYSFPEIFTLYASKPIPHARRVASIRANPSAIAAAVPSRTANLALSAALTAHNLALALAITNTTFCAPAFKKSKILRHALLPIVGLGLAPLAAYTLANKFGALQHTMDPGAATQMAFAGIMTYVGAVAMVGYVAVTTANDQMERVTWAQGVPLWERWVREEERAALDRIAGAWGFEERGRRGEEEGEEWEELREWAGLGGMRLDAVELMDGME